MRKTALLFAIFLCTAVVCAQAQTASIDIGKIEAIAGSKSAAKSKKPAPLPDPATYEDEAQNKQKAKYFTKHISLINNDVFSFALVPNPPPKLAEFNISNGKLAAAKAAKEKDAVYFRKKITLIAGDAFRFHLEPYVTAKKGTKQKEAAVTAAPDAAAPTEATASTVAKEVKFTAKDAAYFKKRISLISGDQFGFSLKAYKATAVKEPVVAKELEATKAPEVAKVKFKAKDAAYFRKHISLIKGDVFGFYLAANGAEKPAPAAVEAPVQTTVQHIAYVPENKFIKGIFAYVPANKEPIPPIASVTNEELQAYLYTKVKTSMDELEGHFTAIAADSMHAKIPQKMPANITAVKQLVGLVYNDTLRAALYQKAADLSLNYEPISIRTTKRYYQDEAIDFTMKALHTYSKMGNPQGMILSYTNLAKVYKDQRVFPQAKWFILQGNTVAREEKDYKNVVNTLIILAGVKRAVNDHELAVDDLLEAQKVANQNHLVKEEIQVQNNLATLYSELGDTEKSANAIRRGTAIEEGIRKAAEAKKLAAAKKQEEADAKKLADAKKAEEAAAKKIADAEAKKVADAKKAEAKATKGKKKTATSAEKNTAVSDTTQKTTLL